MSEGIASLEYFFYNKFNFSYCFTIYWDSVEVTLGFLHENTKNQDLQSHLFIGKGFAVFGGFLAGAVTHKHHAIEIFIGVDGPIQVTVSEKVYHGKILILDSNMCHFAHGSPDRKIILIVDPESEISIKIKKLYLHSSPIVTLHESTLIDSIIAETQKELAGNNFHGDEIFRRVLAHLIEPEIAPVIIDERILKAQDFIRNLDSKRSSLSEIASAVHLSEGRLVHLFKEQVGIPIRRYLLWQRLIHSIHLILEGMSLTDAAHHAAFSDYAHFSRTFKQMFGYALSDIFKNEAQMEITIKKD
jgi:AraC-like DNA-binding protein